MILRRTWLPAVMLASCGVFVSCLDGIGPGGNHRATLHIVPQYEVLRDGTPSDVDSFVITISNPPAADVIERRRLPPGQDTIQIRIDIDLGGSVDTVNITFQGFNAATGLLMYQGSQQVEVTTGGAEEADIPATYVGPGQGVDSVLVNPSATTLQPGGTVQLTYTGYDLDAAMLDDDVPVWYQSTDTAVARVSSAGLVTAVADGQARIYVTAVANRAIRDTSVITVATAAPPAIALNPTSFAIPDTVGTADPLPRVVDVTNSGGGTLTGLATGTIVYGGGATGWLTPSFNVTTAPATLTLQADNNGLAAGTYTATVPVTATGASNNPQNITVTYTVSPAPLVATSLRIVQGYRVLRPADVLNLTLDVRDAGGNPVAPTGVTFLSRATSVATVNATSGQVTAVAGGATVIVATMGALSDSMVVSVTPNGSVFVSAVADSQAFRRAQPVPATTDTIRVLVAIDMRGVSPDELGSYDIQLNWNSTVMEFIRAETVAGGFNAPTVNATQAATGQLVFASADAAGHAGPSVNLVRLIFVGRTAGSTTFARVIDDISASSPSFNNLLPTALSYMGTVRVQ